MALIVGAVMFMLALRWDDPLTFTMGIILIGWSISLTVDHLDTARREKRLAINRAMGKPPEFCAFNPKRRMTPRINEDSTP